MACEDERRAGRGGGGRAEEGGDVPAWLKNVVAIEGQPFFDQVRQGYLPGFRFGGLLAPA